MIGGKIRAKDGIDVTQDCSWQVPGFFRGIDEPHVNPRNCFKDRTRFGKHGNIYKNCFCRRRHPLVDSSCRSFDHRFREKGLSVVALASHLILTFEDIHGVKRSESAAIHHGVSRGVK